MMSDTSEKLDGIFFLSTNFDDHYYELSSELGVGGIGVVYGAFLKNMKTNQVK